MADKITVGIPTYNGARYLKNCLDSILIQTFQNIDIDVVDDCSSDDTVCIAKAYAARDSRVRVVVNDTRLGLTKNFNRCLELARGEYVCVFGQDDVMLAENLSAKFDSLKSNLNVAFVHSNIFVIDEQGNIIQEHWEKKSKRDYILNGREFARELLFGRNQVCCPSVLMRRSAYQRHGGFQPSLYYTCDWEMWMRLAVHYDVACVGAPLVMHRRHPASETHRLAGTRNGIEQEILAKEQILSSYGHLLSSSHDWRRIVRSAGARKALLCARREFYENDLGRSRSTLRLALRYDPLLMTNRSFVELGFKTIIGRYGLKCARLMKSKWRRLRNKPDL